MKKQFPVVPFMAGFAIFSGFIFSALVLGFSSNNRGIINPVHSREIGRVQNIPQEKDQGIGPVKLMKLGPVDKKMADDGKALYNTKCITCHEMDQKKVGPPLRNVTRERTPEFIMNLLLNSAQMQKENPTIKDLLKKYNNVPMPDPAFNQTQARAVLEYLRSVTK